MESGQHDQARQYFDLIQSRHPLAPEAGEAALLSADSYFQEGRYAEAAAAYQEFSRLHPSHSEAARVDLQIAMSHFRQVPRAAERDLSPALAAIDAFREFLRRHPDHPEREKTEQAIRICRTKLAERELSVARFYFRQGEYRSTLLRLHTILDSYPDLGLDDDALYYLGASYYHLEEMEKAREALKTLLDRFPDSPYNSQARAYVGKLEP